MRRFLFLLVLVLAACAPLDANPQIFVRDDEVGVLIDDVTGTLKEPLLPGNHTINALDERVVYYPTFTQVYAFRGAPTETADFATRAPAIDVLTADNVPLSVSMGVVFRLNPAQVNAIHTAWAGMAGDYRAGYIRPTTVNITQTMFSGLTRAELDALAPQVLSDQLAALLRGEFEANGLFLERIDIYGIR